MAQGLYTKNMLIYFYDLHREILENRPKKQHNWITMKPFYKTLGVNHQDWHRKASSVITVCHVWVKNSRVQSVMTFTKIFSNYNKGIWKKAEAWCYFLFLVFLSEVNVQPYKVNSTAYLQQHCVT